MAMMGFGWWGAGRGWELKNYRLKKVDANLAALHFCRLVSPTAVLPSKNVGASPRSFERLCIVAFEFVRSTCHAMFESFHVF